MSNNRVNENFVFQKVMENKELCKEVLERILDVKLSKVEAVTTEKVIEDVWGKTKKIYEMEARGELSKAVSTFDEYITIKAYNNNKTVSKKKSDEKADFSK